ncbi:MAG: outer membrane beta-barrel family protein, partial [Mucilaginibacter sp.]
GYREGKVGRDENEYIVFQAPASYSLWDNTKHGYKNSPSHTYEAGVDYNLDKNNVIGVLVDGYNNSSTRTNLVNTNIYNDHHSNADSALATNSLTNGTIQQYTYNINYKGNLDTGGRTLAADFDYTPYHNNNNQSYSTLSSYPNGSMAITTPAITDISKQQINIFTGKIDFVNPFKNKWRLDAGLKYSSIQNNNDFENYILTNNEQIFNVTGSNKFRYSETTSAAYGNLSASIGKLSLQIGLRGEYTRTSGLSVNTDSLHKNNYFKLFPTVYFQYPVSKDNELNFYYGKRISRPDYWRLNPFKYYTSPYTYLEGNPFLQPSFTNSFELSDTYEQNYGIAAFYDRTIDVFSNITQQNNITKVFFDTQDNLGKSIQTGLYGFATFNLMNWWSLDSYIRGTYKIEQSAYLQGSYDYHKMTGYGSITNDFTISKKNGLRAEISGWYSTPGIQGIFKVGRRYDLSSAVSKSIFNGQGNLRLSVSDILNSNKYKIDVNYLDQQNGFVETNDTRIVNFTFSIRFGNS